MSVLLFASLFPFVSVYMYFVWAGSAESTQVLYGFTKFIQFSFPLIVWIFRKESIKNKFNIENRSYQNLVIAFGTSLVFLIVGSVGYFAYLRNYIRNDQTREAILDRLQAFGADHILSFIILAIFIAVIHSFLEEYYWRLFVHAEMQKYFSARWSVLLSSVAFTLHHIIVVNKYAVSEPRWVFVLLGSVAVFFCGLLWSYQFNKTKKLWVVWFSHIFADIVALGIGFDIVFLN